MSSELQYAPPPYPPPKPSLLQPQISLPYEIDLNKLATHGWVSLPIINGPADPLYGPYAALFASSSAFLGLPETQLEEKYAPPPQAEFQKSEEGFQRIPGEKRMITLRTADAAPSEFELGRRAAEAWRASGAVMEGVLGAIEESLAMPRGALTRTAEKQGELPPPGEGRVASLMRVFRYDRAGADKETPPAPRIVADTHKDLGLLTIVVGHSPGLECWDVAQGSSGNWVACEAGEGEGLRATLLAGQTLAKFTNWRYAAGRHRVFVHPRAPESNAGAESPLADPAYRFSLVHALRAHLPVRVSHTDFETPVTGRYAPGTQFVDVPIADIYRAISNAHWNVNIGVAERERQRQRLMQNGDSGRSSARQGEKGIVST